MRLIRGLAAVLVGLLLVVLPAAGPASAQTEQLHLDVAGDGATGVTVQATDAAGNRLEKVVRLVLTATGPDGRTVGPMQLQPAGEGQGFYSTGPILEPGDWQVTVTAPAPYAGEVTVAVQAAPAQSPPPPPPASAAPAADAAGSTAAGWWMWPAGLAGLAVLLAGAAALVARRQRAAKQP